MSFNSLITSTTDAFGSRRRSAVSPGMLFDDWVVAETEAAIALAEWRSAPRSRKSAAYAAYAAALDTEAAAAAQLEQCFSAANREP